MYGLWNSIRTSVEETIETIVLSPKKLRKKFTENENSSKFSEPSKSSEKEYFDSPIKKNNRTSKYKSLFSFNNAQDQPDDLSIKDINSQIPIEDTSSSGLETIISSETQAIKNPEKQLTETALLFSKSEFVEIPDDRITTQIDSSKDGNSPVINKTHTICKNISENSVKRNTTRFTTSLTSSSILKPKPSPPRRTNTLGNIDIGLINVEGNNESVDIDIAEVEESKGEEKCSQNTRRQSISDRISRRRTSELAAEIIRLSAENRKKEFADLLNEHDEIVQNIEIWKTTGILPPVKTQKKAALPTVNDEDSDETIDEDPVYYRHVNDSSSLYLSSNSGKKESNIITHSH